LYGNVKITGDPTWAKRDAVYDGCFDLRKLLKKNICHQAIFYRSEFLLRSVGCYNEKYVPCADWDFNLRCWSKGVFEFLDVTVAGFHAGGISSRSGIGDTFAREVADNVIRYFGLSAFDPLLTDPSFVGHSSMLSIQTKEDRHRVLAQQSVARVSRSFLAVGRRAIQIIRRGVGRQML
jgi:hypothetical protein